MAVLQHKPKHKTTRKLGIQAIAGMVLVSIGVLLCTMPLMFMVGNLNKQSSVTEVHEDESLKLAKEQRRQEIKEAREYNERLASGGQNVLGEVTDPFSGGDDGKTLSEQDEDYRSQLDTPADGIMATVKYPKLGINLPVRHGTSSKVLDMGAGHMYGTSLPVGGSGTHAVISAHTGLADQVMFDRLSLRQAKVGDFFYITVLDETLAYKVKSITVVEPNQFDGLKIVEGEDLVTLLTCTPYGVNNMRILVTGERTTMPHPAPNLKDAAKDNTGKYIVAVIAAAWALALTLMVVYVKRKPKKKTKHARTTRPKDDSPELPVN